jgi:hypothetical protein
MSLNLPLHPTMRHALTGEPLRALYVDKHGRPRYPIMGGAEDDDAGGSADDKADDSSGGDTKSDDKPDQSADTGFPANTPVAEMTLEQQVAYHKFQSRKHEERASEYRSAAGGKTAAEIKADLDAAAALKREKLTEQERAVEDAKREAREATASEYGPKAVRTAFELALRNLPDEERGEFIEELDLKKFLTDSGDVDTAKVLSRAEKIAPADKDKGGRPKFDFGGGSRGDTRTKTGVAAGSALFDASRKKSTTTDS